jgi:hypothetical protein
MIAERVRDGWEGRNKVEELFYLISMRIFVSGPETRLVGLDGVRGRGPVFGKAVVLGPGGCTTTLVPRPGGVLIKRT